MDWASLVIVGVGLAIAGVVAWLERRAEARFQRRWTSEFDSLRNSEKKGPR